jgi:hypothetical protein
MNAVNKVKSLNASGTAVAITAALIVIAFLIGGTRSLGGLRADGEAVFTEGTAESGPDSFDIKLELSNYFGKTANVATVAGKYSPEMAEYSELNAAREAFKEAISGRDFGEMYIRYAALSSASNRMNELLLNGNKLTDTEQRSILGNSAEMTSIGERISRMSAQYNHGAMEFNAKLENIPASWIKTLGLVKPLPLFN